MTRLSDQDIISGAGRVAVLMGGTSAERGISLVSGAAVHRALQAAGVDAVPVDWQDSLPAALDGVDYDRAFIALHGRGGEDGTVQAYLELMGKPYTGSGVLGSALAMDKVRSKRIWRDAGLPTPDFRVVASAADGDAAVEALGLPLVVKPAQEGSSFGVARINEAGEFAAAFEAAAGFGCEVLAERCVIGGEYTVPVLEGRALPVIRLETPREFYDYTAKYEADSTQYICPAGLSDGEERAAGALALAAVAALGTAGWARVDFFIDEHGQMQLIELNTVPGMTDHSLVPMSAAQTGMDFQQLVVRILGTSFGQRT